MTSVRYGKYYGEEFAMQNSLKLDQSFRLVQQPSQFPIEINKSEQKSKYKQQQESIIQAKNDQQITKDQKIINSLIESMKIQSQIICRCPPFFSCQFIFRKKKEKNIDYDFQSLYFLGLMHFKSETIKNPSSKQIVLPKKQKNKSIMSVTIKSIILCQKTELTIHSQSPVKQILKVNPNSNPNLNPNPNPNPSNISHSKPQLLYENFSKLKKNSLCQLLHSQKVSVPVFKRCKTQIYPFPKSNRLVFKAQIGAFVKNIQKKHSYYDLPIKWSRQSPFNLANLRRSFKISNHYKSSLMDMNFKNRYQKIETISQQTSNNNFSMKLDRPTKRKNSLIIPLRKKSKAERGSERKDEIKGWEDTQVRYKSLQFSDLY